MRAFAIGSSVVVKIISDKSGSILVEAPGSGINTTYTLSPGLTNILISGYDVRAYRNGIENKGVKLTSSVEVAIFVFEGPEWSTNDVVTLIPVRSDATNFVVQSYTPYYPSTRNPGRSHFIIVATENTTSVDITLKTTGNLTYNQTQFASGETIVVILDDLQTFYLYHEHDLSGSIIESNKPVAVFAGACPIMIPPDVRWGDRIATQMVQVEHWETSFIVPPNYHAPSYLIRVFAFYNDSAVFVRDSNTVTINGTLNRGEFMDVYLNSVPAVVSSDTKISVVLYGLAENSSKSHKMNPYMTVLPGVRQYVTTSHIFPTLLYGYKDRDFENYVSVILAKQFKTSLVYNGEAMDVLREDTVPRPFDDYVVVVAKLQNETTHNITTTIASVPSVAFVCGLAEGITYGFMTGLNFESQGEFYNCLCSLSLHSDVSYIIYYINYLRIDS